MLALARGWTVQLRLLLAGLAMLAALPALAAPVPETGTPTTQACRSRPASPEGRPRVGLVLGGGGARGIAHISVLRQLEAMRVPVDCIAGTSMGALVGAMYASGMGVDDIEKTVLSLDWPRLFDDSLERPERSFRRKRDDELVISAPGVGIGKKGVKIAGGILGGERILLLFEKLVEPVATIEDFDRLPIPFRAVAADINDGEPVLIQGGDLALAMRASMSLPGLFPPVPIDGHVLVDGGIARNLPVDVARQMGADIIIAVDVGTPLAQLDPSASALAITSQLTGLMTVGNTREQIATLSARDVLLTPALGETVTTASFDKGAEALAIGRDAAQAAAPRFAALSLDGSAYQQHVATRTGRDSAPPLVQFVRLDNNSRYRDEVILARVPVPLGQPLDSAALEAAMHQVYGLGTLSQATYEVVEEGGRTGVVLHVGEKSQGPNYLEAGLSASSDMNGRSNFNVRVGVLRSPVNDTGGEVRTMLQLGDEPRVLAEYYQPFGLRSRYFVGARAEYESRGINTFDDEGNRTSEYEARQAGINLSGGREFGNYGAALVGLRRYTGTTRVEVGDPTLPETDYDIGEVFLEGSLDRLDSAYLPRKGYSLRLRYTRSLDALGADGEFEQADFDAISAWSFGKHSVLGGLRYHVTTSGVAPLQSLYRLGGFSRLVGYQPNELTGQNYGVLLGGYSYEIGKLLGQEAMAGVLLEYGNAWNRRADMSLSGSNLNGSVYVGFDSWLGPILFGAGAREGGEHNLFLEVGHRF
jgi:NTE family protein